MSSWNDSRVDNSRAGGHPGVPPQYGAPSQYGVPSQYDDGYADDEPYRPRRPRRRTAKRVLITLVVVLLVASVATYFWADSKLRKEVDLSKVIDRPEAGDGTNYLIVGSDSREGMSEPQKKDLHNGAPDGKRTDSMMILHDGSSGPTLI